MKIRIVGEPMFNRYGVPGALILLAREFHRRGIDLEIVSSLIKPEVRIELERFASVIDLGFKNVLFNEASTSYVEIWLREAIMRQISKRAKQLVGREDSMTSATINMSNTIAIESTAWYAQGPVFEAMEHAYPFAPLKYKVPYIIAKRLIKYLDLKLMQSLRKLSRIACANSYTIRGVYERLGISIDCVIYAPLDTEFFQPKTNRPRGDYVLTYFGKETDYTAVRKVADKGVKIKAFGGKASSIVPKYVLNHPNIEVLGYVTDSELVELYSNALFTLFPFTEEPFGYVPVESMACGTPVLTYNRQGPSETVDHGVTGWLVNSDEELADLAIRIWREGYPSWMRSKSREKALQFDAKTIANQWIEILKKIA
ncbi:MAG: glycosyltransferase family 4 protein [Ignisphaera sp.]|nr:glycosyltransferase family 4 protein [Ignisphaera sp.]